MADAPTDLERALAGLATDPSPAGQRAVYEALLAGELLVPRDAGGAVLIDRGSRARGPALWVFSGERSVGLWGLAADTVPVPARDLLAFAVSHGVEQVAIDTAGPVAATLGSWEVRRLAVGEIPTQGSDERLAIALPRTPLPAAFTDALAGAAAPLDAALTAVSVYEADPVRGRRHLLIGLHVDADAPLAAFVDVLHAALERIAPDGALLNYTTVADAPPFASLEPGAVVWRR